MVGSPGGELDILLLTMPSVLNNLEEIRASIGTNDNKIMERNSNFEFVTAYMNPEYYLPRCFPTLFPYGRGCPSDVNGTKITMRAHSAHMLCRGGGPNPRSFQNCTNYIFTMYTMEMKRKIGGVAYIAERKYLDGSREEEDTPPTAEEILNLLSYLEDDVGVTNNMTSNITNNDIHREEMRHLLNRLIPYAKGLQGTPMQISHEKTKLMAMISSPIINKEGCFRWFTTFAPADLYENRLMEIVQDVIIDESDNAWLARSEKVLKLFSNETLAKR